MPSVGPNYVGSGGSSAISGATWATLANAEGSTTGTYATWTSATRSDTATWQGTGFLFTTSTVPTGSIFNSVDVVVRHFESSTTIIASVTAQLFKSGTAIGSPVALTRATAVREDTFNVPASAALTTADLPNLQVRVVATRTNTTTSTTLSIDSARITVNYTSGTDRYSTAIIADNPTAYYRLNDSGTTAVDATGNGNAGTLTGGVTTGVAGGIDGSDTAMSFNGSTGYITLPRADFPAEGTAVSLECKFKTAATGGICGLSAAATPGGAAGSNVPPLFIGTSGAVDGSVWYYGTGAITSASGVDYRDGNWHHAVITYSSGTETLYVDGVQKAQRTGLTVTNFAPTVVWLGVAHSGGTAFTDTPGGWFFLNGTLDEVATYNYALTPTQVVTHYAAGVPVAETATGVDSAALIKVNVSELASAIDSGSASVAATAKSGSETVAGADATSLISLYATSAIVGSAIVGQSIVGYSDGEIAGGGVYSSSSYGGAVYGDAPDSVTLIALSISESAGSVPDVAALIALGVGESATAVDSGSQSVAGGTTPSGADTGAGTDTVTRIALASAESGTAADAITRIGVGTAESGTGSESTSRGVSVAEVGSGVDLASRIDLNNAQTASAADTVSQIAVGTNESAVGSETPSRIGISVSDTGSVVDSASVQDLTAGQPIASAEAGGGSDVETLIALNAPEGGPLPRFTQVRSDNQNAAAQDTVSINVQASVSQTASLADFATVVTPITVSETASGADTVVSPYAFISGVEQAGIVDSAVPIVAITVPDSASAVDFSTALIIPNPIFAAETSSGSDIVTRVALSAADFATTAYTLRDDEVATVTENAIVNAMGLGELHVRRVFADREKLGNATAKPVPKSGRREIVKPRR